MTYIVSIADDTLGIGRLMITSEIRKGKDYAYQTKIDGEWVDCYDVMKIETVGGVE